MQQTYVCIWSRLNVMHDEAIWVSNQCDEASWFARQQSQVQRWEATNSYNTWNKSNGNRAETNQTINATTMYDETAMQSCI